MAFINAYLDSLSTDPINLDKFRTLPSSKATGAQHIGPLTNLMQLTWITVGGLATAAALKTPIWEARSLKPSRVCVMGNFWRFPDTMVTSPANHIQTIANTADFHFGHIEQGSSSLYPTLAQRVINLEVLRILLSFYPTETAHFKTWHDKAGNAPVLTDPTNGLVFPDLNASGGEDTQTNLIMPKSTVFLNSKFTAVSIIRPTEIAASGGAVVTIKSFSAYGLFIGQSQEFFAVLNQLAEQADAARRG